MYIISLDFFVYKRYKYYFTCIFLLNYKKQISLFVSFVRIKDTNSVICIFYFKNLNNTNNGYKWDILLVLALTIGGLIDCMHSSLLCCWRGYGLMTIIIIFNPISRSKTESGWGMVTKNPHSYFVQRED